MFARPTKKYVKRLALAVIVLTWRAYSWRRGRSLESL